MSLLVITGRGGDTAPDTANRDVARTRALARHVEHLGVLEADETWWTPIGARNPTIAPEPGSSEPSLDPRRSSLGVALANAAAREPGTVLLLLGAHLRQVKQIQPLAQRLGLRLLWWHEELPPSGIVAELSGTIAGLLTMWPSRQARPGWLWNVGAGIDFQAVPAIETLPARPPLRILAWAPSRESELNTLLHALAYVRGLTVDVHLTVAITKAGVADGQRHQIEAHVRNLALTRSANVAIVDGPENFGPMLAAAHALVDVEGPEGTLPLAALLAMAHGRPVLSSRDELASLLEATPLPLRFTMGDERQLADGMKSLAAGWSDELADAGQTLRDAVRQEHSVGAWAEAVASIVGFVRTPSQVAREPDASEPSAEVIPSTGSRWSAPSSLPSPSSEQPGPDASEPSVEGIPPTDNSSSAPSPSSEQPGPDASEPSAEVVPSTNNSSSAPSPSSEQAEPDVTEDAPNGQGVPETASDSAAEDTPVGASRRWRRRLRRSDNQ